MTSPVLTKDIPGALADVEKKVREALAAEGFGVLTEVDVQATLKAKLGEDTRPYRILGACNPALAHRSLTAEPRVGAFLPCGVALYESVPGTTTVAAQDPATMAQVFDSKELTAVAAEVRAKLERVIAAV